ncbi:MAG: phosphotransferase-like protein [Acidimicrobiales bacterium]
MTRPGWVVVLNGAPRSGKSSLAVALAAQGGPTWTIRGVDSVLAATPSDLLPAMGLRPGGERPDLEPLVLDQVGELFDHVATDSRSGLDVAVDIGLHDHYSRPLGLWALAADRLGDVPVMVVGVRCPLPELMRRRNLDRSGTYQGSTHGDPVPEVVERWDRAVHDPGIYDIEIDTSTTAPKVGAARILRRLDGPPPPAALRQHGATDRPGGA